MAIYNAFDNYLTTGGRLASAKFTDITRSSYTDWNTFILETNFAEGAFDIQQIINNAVTGEDYTICTFSESNAVFGIHINSKTSSYVDFYLYIQPPNQSLINLYSLAGGLSANPRFWIFSFAFNTQINDYVLTMFRAYYLNGDTRVNTYYSAGLGDVIDYVTGGPDYIWEPFDTLNGNNGQYRCKLTMINADKIGDYTTPIITSDRDDFDRISEQASLLSYFQNAPLAVPVTVAWSGDNWLTMTAIKNLEPDTKDYLLTLQFRYALTESIIYSYTARIQLEDYRHIPYLSFIVDDENEVAVFDCVTYYSASQSDPNPHWGYLGRNQTEASMHALWLWLQDSIGNPESDSPFNGGTSDNGGEGGNPTPQDNMPRPALPSLDAANLGFFTVYNFTESDETQLQDIADFLWSDNVLDNFKKYFTNFSDNIFALYILPYTPSTLPTKNFKVGRLESEDITNVKYLVSRYVDIPMGEVKVDPRWTSYIDYSPYTRFELYLPGIGIHSIDADDIMSPANSDGVLNSEQGSLISLRYTVDLFTGIVVAFVFINGQMRYQFSGKVGQTIPISGENYNSMVTAFITGAASLASSIASGGLSAPLAGAAVAGTISAQKPEVYRSGNMSGDVSLMSERTPYLIRHVPNKPEIIEQEKFTGFPSYKTGKVKDFGGYFEAEEIHVEGISCTEDERDELIELFKSGVIL